MSSKLTAGSMIDLRAELARKQAQYRQEKQQPQLKDQRIEAERAKRATSWLKVNRGVARRNQLDLLEEAKDAKTLVRVEAQLKAKAALYEKLRLGQLSEEEQEKYLVDFEHKYMDRIFRSRADGAGRASPSPYDKEIVEYIDEFGRTRTCKRMDLPRHDRSPEPRSPPRGFVRDSGAAYDAADTEDDYGRERELMSADMRREADRRRWEDGEQEEMTRGSIHYETVRQGEIRQLGTGYYAFSKDADERAKQMDELNALRDETKEGQRRQQNIKDRRKRQLELRLAKIQARKEGRDVKEVVAVHETAAAEKAAAAAAPEEDIDSFLQEMRAEAEMAAAARKRVEASLQREADENQAKQSGRRQSSQSAKKSKLIL